MRKLTTEQWIEKCKKVHGDEYDYSESEYINAKTKVKIKCKKHNIIFEITPDNHRRGEGCPICRYEKSARKMSQPIEDFIKRANEIHNGKYDYSRVKYVNNRTKVEIVCPEHGIFLQTPEKHILRKQGCPHCSGNAKRTLESFINDAQNVHCDKYDYSKSEYNGIHTPLTIICPIHGEFLQRPGDHLRGQGCPHCRQSKIESEVRSLLEENNIEFIQQYKYDETNGKNKLDFFLLGKNVGIECQGEQHFKPVDFANNGKEWAEELFEKNIQRDVYKNQLCRDKGIRLLYYVPKSNTVPGYKSSSKFCGLYTNENVYNNLNQLKEGVSFDDI